MRHAMILCCLAAACLAGPAVAQTASLDGVTDTKYLRGGTGVMGSMVVGDFHVGHRDGFKGAQRVAISVFNVAFPNENRLTASMNKKAGKMRYACKAGMHTTLTGVDQGARQRIADAAYATFVEDLKGAGYDVVGPDELARLTPEYATWTAQPNFTEGRFGTYVAPTGRKVYFLQADASRRDTSGLGGSMSLTFRALDRPQAMMRSAYIARDGNIGIIAVTLVVDYGIYSTAGTTGRVKDGCSASFVAGVTAQSGSLFDTATMLEYWRPASGGFPAIEALAAPIHATDDVGAVGAGAGDIDYTMKADPAKFEKVALGVVKDAAAKMVSTMASSREVARFI